MLYLERLEWGRTLALLGLFTALGLLVIYPVGHLVAMSLSGPAGLTLTHYIAFLTRPDLLEALVNSFTIAFGTTLGSIVIGVPMAWAVARTTMPFRGVVRNMTFLTFASPSFLGALAWILLLGPHTGKLNLWLQQILNLEKPPFNIFSPYGIIFVLIMFSYPLVFMPTVAALENMGGSLVEAARILGASRWRTARDITVPLVVPAILSGAILVFIEGLVIFGAVAVLGMPILYFTLSTKMYTLLKFPPRLELAAVMAFPIILSMAGLLLLQRVYLGRRQFHVTTGKAQQLKPQDLGVWRYLLAAACLAVILVSVVLPFGTLLQVSVQKTLGNPFGRDNFTLLGNFRYLLQQPAAVRALVHSFVLAIGGVLVALGLGMLASWMVERSRAPGTQLLPLLMVSPFAFTGPALGIALILGYGGPPFRLAGTLGILLLAYLIRSLPITFSYARGALAQISPELEEACRTTGGTWFHSLRDVVFPLMRNGLLAAGLVQFVLMFRELGTSVFLFTGGNEVSAVVIFDFAQEAQFSLMAAMSVIVAAVNLSVIIVARRWLSVSGRTGLSIGV